ncbi:MAG: CDP-alcohol phosphatidyltransferase family protein [Microthrixaceae bacterium]|nr:CDP-alcohol phosphatidyltransferase family protein [Microthrixaceae bacterium]
MGHDSAIPSQDALGPRRRGLAGEAIPEGEDRLLTAPNVITLMRLLCIPLFVWMLFGADLRWQSALLMALLGATDWVDGYVARRFGQVSNFGKMFDPVVDRLLMITGVGSIIVIGAVPLWFGLLVIAREVVMSVFVAAITFMGARRMDVTFIGKTGTFCQMVAFPLFLAGSDTGLSDAVADALLTGAWLFGLPGLVFGYIAFVGYLREGPRALAEGRAAHTADVERATRLAAGTPRLEEKQHRADPQREETR